MGPKFWVPLREQMKKFRAVGIASLRENGDQESKPTTVGVKGRQARTAEGHKDLQAG